MKSSDYAQMAQNVLVGCCCLEMRDEGDTWWDMQVGQARMAIEELVEQLGCSTNQLDSVVAMLQCPRCSSRFREHFDCVVDNTRLRQLTDEIEQEIELSRLDKRYQKALRAHEHSIKSFCEHLALYPALGSKHELGRRIMRAIAANGVTLMALPVGGILYRARRAEGDKVLSQKDFMATPSYYARGGRFNYPGHSAWYLSDSKRGSELELVKDSCEKRLVWVQEFRSTKKIEKILDLRFSEGEIYGQLNNEILAALMAAGAVFEPVRKETGEWKPQYLVTRFLADCARYYGLAGIMYTPSIDGHPGFNLVLFEQTEDLEPVGDPRIYVAEPDSPRFSVHTLTDEGFERIFYGDKKQ